MTGNPLTEEALNNIVRLEKRISELQAIDIDNITAPHPPELQAISSKILVSLESIFGLDNNRYNQFKRAADLYIQYKYFTAEGPAKIAISEYKSKLKIKIDRSIEMLTSAVETIEEECVVTNSQYKTEAAVRNRKIFIVHGHDDAALQSVARFIENLSFKAVILSEQPNKSRTIIEKIEENSDVGFAVVLLTPDDTGSKTGDVPKPRARQNVLLELGYFMGRLGRKYVCTLKRDEVEIPTDFAGVVWEAFDPAGAWKARLAKELEAAGFDIDWSKLGS